MKTLSITFIMLVAITLVGCGEKPMTDADMAEKYGLSLEEYQEQKEAAARMNMTIEDHLNMGHGSTMDHETMNHDKMDEEEEMMDHSQMSTGLEDLSESEIKSHEQAAADMGMTLEEHEAAGHIGH